MNVGLPKHGKRCSGVRRSIEPVFDVVLGSCSRELLGGNGFQREVSTIPQQPDPGRAFAGGVHSKVTDRSPLFRRSCSVCKSVPKALQVPLHRRWTTPLIRCPEEPTRHGSEWQVEGAGKLARPTRRRDAYCWRFPGFTLAANRRVGMIRWLVSSAKETVTPEGSLWFRRVGAQVQSDGQQDRGKHVNLVCTQLWTVFRCR